MTTYTVTAWCAYPHYTTFQVKARSFAEALRKARKRAPEEFPEPCDGGATDWDEFQICSPRGESKPRTYFERARRIEMAAQQMLEALILCHEVLRDFARLDDGTPSVSALFMARDAIAKATEEGEVAP
jgi:hypothetical protein